MQGSISVLDPNNNSLSEFQCTFNLITVLSVKQYKTVTSAS